MNCYCGEEVDVPHRTCELLHHSVNCYRQNMGRRCDDCEELARHQRERTQP